MILDSALESSRWRQSVLSPTPSFATSAAMGATPLAKRPARPSARTDNAVQDAPNTASGNIIVKPTDFSNQLTVTN
jgi:hypothetical protein